MTTLKRLRGTVGLAILRLLFSRHGVFVLLASMLLGAVGAARYLDQSPTHDVLHTTGIGPSKSCGAPYYAAFAYNPETKMYYCVPYPS